MLHLAIRILLFLLLGVVLAKPAIGEETWFVSTPTGEWLPDRESDLTPEREGPRAFMEALDRFALGGAASSTELDLNRYQAVGRSGPWRLQIGRQESEEDSLILSRMLRRGVSVRLSGGPRRGALTGFILQTRDESSSASNLGLEDENNRMAGLSGDMTLLERGPAVIRLGVSGLAGHRPESGGEGQWGRALGFRMDGGLGDHFTFGGEFARSRFDSDGFDGGESGWASILRARYQSSFGAKEDPVYWHLGVEKILIDPFFYSLGNPWQDQDREVLRLSGGLRRGPLALSLVFSRKWEDQQTLHSPAVQREQMRMSLDYWAEEKTPFLGILGTPSWHLVYESNDSASLSSEENGLPSSYRRKSTALLRFKQERWSWQTGYRATVYGEGSGYHWQSQGGDLNAEIPLGSRLLLWPSLEWERQEASPGRSEGSRIALRLKGRIDLIPEWLSGRWNLFLEESRSISGVRSRTEGVGGELNLTLRQPKRDRAGVDLALRASRRHQDYLSSGTADESEYNLSLVLNMTLPSA